MSSLMHLRLVGINLTVYGIFFSTLFGLYFFTRYASKLYFAPIGIFLYLSFFLLLGLFNQNNLYYTIYDFIKLVSLSGFFLLGYYYFKNAKSEKFLEFMHYSSKITVIFFIITFIVVVFLWKVLMMPIYAQVQVDLIFLVMLSLYEKKHMKWAVVLSILSLKRMVLISVVFVFLIFTKKDRFFLLAFTLITILYILYDHSDFDFLSKYSYTFERIKTGLLDFYSFNMGELTALIYAVDNTRGSEFEHVLNSVIESYSYIFFGDGMGGGVVQREYADGRTVSVSFAHIVYISLVAKMGFIGLAIPLLIFFTLLYKAPNSKNVFVIFILGLVMSFFAGYIVSSWAFWLCLGAGLGNCQNPQTH